MSEVGSAMAEQGEGSSQILLALKAMNEISEKVRASSAEMSAGNADILRSIGRLKESALEIEGSVGEVVSGVSEVTKSMEGVSRVTEETGSLITSLDEAVGRFRT